MRDVEQLTETLRRDARRRFPADACEAVEAAMSMAARAHARQRRKGGDPYLLHPLRVALSLLDEFRVDDPEIVVAGLLHDVLEDAADLVSAQDIEQRFGARVVRMIEAVTWVADEAEDATRRYDRKAAQARAAGPDVWRIKLADRLDNLRDAGAVPGEAGRRFRRRYRDDSLRNYLPMAEALGDFTITARLRAAIAHLKENGPMASRVNRAGIELNVSRMRLPNNLDERYGPLLDRAVQKIAQLEAGAIANVDEGWQVGHNWLRNPQLAPAEYRDGMIAANKQIEQFAARFPELQLANVVWVGIGGSAMAPQLLCDALQAVGAGPQMFFFDNTDPAGFDRTLGQINAVGGLSQTMVVVVSKSGGTKETRTGMRVLQQQFAAEQLSFSRQAVAVTRPDSALHQEAEGWLERFPLWDWVGGRTSMFSPVGMLPAALCGLNHSAIAAGAAAMDDATRGRQLDDNPALLLATTWYHNVEVRGLRNMVVLPYCDRLLLLSKYLQQLIMESLGKDGKGISVFGNKGSTDQHSFVQQLREGYADFFATFLCVNDPGRDWDVDPEVAADPATWRKPRTTISSGDYLAAFQEGTAEALYEAGRPSLKLTVDRLTPAAVGGLVALFERAVGFYAEMIGINAYHQPGVEAGKKAAERVLDEQSALVFCLQQAKSLSVGELAKKTGVSVERTHDTLRRLHICGRLGIHLAEQSPTTPLTAVQFVYSPD